MTRNDQMTRQWYLLRRLEGSAGATLQELADGLPGDFRRPPAVTFPVTGPWEARGEA